MMMVLILMAASPQTSAAASPDAATITPPKPSTRQDGLIGVSDYPAEALAKHQEGRTILTVHVTAKGKVDGCSVLASSGSKSLDDATCLFVRHVRFDPAHDAAGHAVEADTQFPMNWRLPRR
ncbi:energy transducer TonB [Sphingomonas fuzhouensis]|uniref:energy transducer TonB n=1 Tax=Sphingomonas fuzhouensis TaxID=3106033 RepID=UPI002AFFA912|nr:energy transducer TonB [Sphingomonas sp. SGZ-02]